MPVTKVRSSRFSKGNTAVQFRAVVQHQRAVLPAAVLQRLFYGVLAGAQMALNPAKLSSSLVSIKLMRSQSPSLKTCPNVRV